MLLINSRDRTVDNKIRRLSDRLREVTERLDAVGKPPTTRNGPGR